MRRITFSADEDLIDRVRAAARAQGKTLSEMFREWLDQVVSAHEAARDYESLMKRLTYVNTGGRKFTRDEMNERLTNHSRWLPGSERLNACVAATRCSWRFRARAVVSPPSGKSASLADAVRYRHRVPPRRRGHECGTGECHR